MRDTSVVFGFHGRSALSWGHQWVRSWNILSPPCSRNTKRNGVVPARNPFGHMSYSRSVVVVKHMDKLFLRKGIDHEEHGSPLIAMRSSRVNVAGIDCHNWLWTNFLRHSTRLGLVEIRGNCVQLSKKTNKVYRGSFLRMRTLREVLTTIGTLSFHDLDQRCGNIVLGPARLQSV